MIIGSALDVVEHCGVTRFVFTDFPLGNPCGPPYRRDIQRAVVKLALDLLSSASGPRTTVMAPFAWDDPDWRGRYGRVDPAKRDELLEAGRQRRARRSAMRPRGTANES